MRSAKGRSMAPETSLETKIEVVRVQLDGLVSKVTDFILDTRQWREELKSDTSKRIQRLEDQSLEASKMVIARVEALERDAVKSSEAKTLDDRVTTLETNKVAQEAIERYKKWLIATTITAGAACVTAIVNTYRLYSLLPK
jgi:hypothetical protein